MLLSVIARIESVVVDEDARPFARFYAWYRLVRHWSAMRFDDTLGVCPGSTAERARGIAGCLERTRTSGPGKAMRVLPFFVSDEAWVRERAWLRTGLAVLRTSFGGARDYLLPLRNENFDGELGRRALYSDAAGFSRQLLRGLQLPADNPLPLLLPESARCWTEHSDRSGLDTWSASAGVPRWKRDFPGRWSAQGSSDKYVRTAWRIIEAIQVKVARLARVSLNSGPDYFGEEQTLSELETFLSKQGLADEAISIQSLQFTAADTSLQVRLPAVEEGEDIYEPSAPETCAGADFGMGALAPADLHLLGVPDVASDVEILDAVFVQADVKGEETVYEPSDASDDSGRSAHALLEDELPRVSPHVFVVSQIGARRRRLHFVGHCFRRPGEHDKDFIVFGDTVPDEGDFDKVCCSCFPRGFVLNDSAPQEDESSDSSSTTDWPGA